LLGFSQAINEQAENHGESGSRRLGPVDQ
jgi:hypothetical protein